MARKDPKKSMDDPLIRPAMVAGYFFEGFTWHWVGITLDSHEEMFGG